MATVDEILEELKASGRAERLEGIARYGIRTHNRLGVHMPDLRRIAKQAGKDHSLATALWQTGIGEARIVASLVGEANKLTEAQMDRWANDFDSWDVCDQVCMNLFDKTPLAWKKIREWATGDAEFVRRAAFALIAALAAHDKQTDDKRFIALLDLIEGAVTDERKYVKKAVNWALRGIGKRNGALNAAAIRKAEKIWEIDSKAAKWIASDALRELRSEKVQRRLKG